MGEIDDHVEALAVVQGREGFQRDVQSADSGQLSGVLAEPGMSLAVDRGDKTDARVLRDQLDQPDSHPPARAMKPNTHSRRAHGPDFLSAYRDVLRKSMTWRQGAVVHAPDSASE